MSDKMVELEEKLQTIDRTIYGVKIGAIVFAACCLAFFGFQFRLINHHVEAGFKEITQGKIEKALEKADELLKLDTSSVYLLQRGVRFGHIDGDTKPKPENYSGGWTCEKILKETKEKNHCFYKVTFNPVLENTPVVAVTSPSNNQVPYIAEVFDIKETGFNVHILDEDKNTAHLNFSFIAICKDDTLTSESKSTSQKQAE